MVMIMMMMVWKARLPSGRGAQARASTAGNSGAGRRLAGGPSSTIPPPRSPLGFCEEAPRCWSSGSVQSLASVPQSEPGYRRRHVWVSGGPCLVGRAAYGYCTALLRRARWRLTCASTRAAQAAETLPQ
eukprot:scaffold211_cov447-Prasinococcus_capsulatus_cf.AAC.10